MAFLGRLFILVCVMVVAVTSKSLPGSEPHKPDSSLGVLRFKIKVTESGTTFTEELEIDTEDGIETFHVPQHNQVDESSVKHLFGLNVTVYRFPLKGACYVTALRSQQTNPTKLAQDLTMQNDQQGTEADITSSTLIIRGEAPNDEPWNSPKIQHFCRGLRILYAERSEDYNNWMIIPDDDDATPGITRKRRQTNSPNGKCPPGLQPREFCPQDSIQKRCYVEGKSCTYLRKCGRIEEDGKMKFDCVTIHLYDEIVCCTTYCDN